jgi:hypothetical protein
MCGFADARGLRRIWVIRDEATSAVAAWRTLFDRPKATSELVVFLNDRNIPVDDERG